MYVECIKYKRLIFLSMILIQYHKNEYCLLKIKMLRHNTCLINIILVHHNCIHKRPLQQVNILCAKTLMARKLQMLTIQATLP